MLGRSHKTQALAWEDAWEAWAPGKTLRSRARRRRNTICQRPMRTRTSAPSVQYARRMSLRGLVQKPFCVPILESIGLLKCNRSNLVERWEEEQPPG
jgi:hypothetical protein